MTARRRLGDVVQRRHPELRQRLRVAAVDRELDRGRHRSPVGVSALVRPGFRARSRTYWARVWWWSSIRTIATLPDPVTRRTCSPLGQTASSGSRWAWLSSAPATTAVPVSNTTIWAPETAIGRVSERSLTATAAENRSLRVMTLRSRVGPAGRLHEA